jgi:hypothetical protein
MFLEGTMARTKNFVLGLMVAAAALSGACASMGSRSISEVQTNPGKFHDKTVTVEGVVTTSFGIPLVPFKVFRVSDGSAEMLVISDEDRIPGKNARVRVRGEVQEFALLGGRSFGLHLREKSIKYL